VLSAQQFAVCYSTYAQVTSENVFNAASGIFRVIPWYFVVVQRCLPWGYSVDVLRACFEQHSVRPERLTPLYTMFLPPSLRGLSLHLWLEWDCSSLGPCVVTHVPWPCHRAQRNSSWSMTLGSAFSLGEVMGTRHGSGPSALRFSLRSSFLRFRPHSTAKETAFGCPSSRSILRKKTVSARPATPALQLQLLHVPVASPR